ncbi:hypothetical protein HHI36_002766 [Cryptolaemus montrouzieri]|uniref:Uncharacterized protein n=1 Tax=Cryptolaemus montrouzieri TaxID=559131 RepID=A0ABD2PBF0_9CUCU
MKSHPEEQIIPFEVSIPKRVCIDRNEDFWAAVALKEPEETNVQDVLITMPWRLTLTKTLVNTVESCTKGGLAILFTSKKNSS